MTPPIATPAAPLFTASGRNQRQLAIVLARTGTYPLPKWSERCSPARCSPEIS